MDDEEKYRYEPPYEGADDEPIQIIDLRVQPFIDAPPQIIDIGLDSYCLAVYIVLRALNGPQGASWPSLKTISEKVGCSVRQVQRSLRILRDRNIIEITREFEDYKGVIRTNVYLFLSVDDWDTTTKEETDD